MQTADSSVLVAALASWHERHDAALHSVEAMQRFVPHTLAETFAVLTGMQPPYRSPVAQVREALQDLRTRHVALEQPLDVYEEAMEVVERVGRTGGAVYDALVARTAARADATLVTLDGRARAIYTAAEVRFRVLGP